MIHIRHDGRVIPLYGVDLPGELAATDPAPPSIVSPRGGPGTELHRLIERAGNLAGTLARVVGPIAPALASALTLPAPEGCGCAAYAAWMDRQGPQGCRQRLDAITDHLIAQGERQGLLVPRWAARAVVRHAIRLAERAGEGPARENAPPGS